MKITVVGTGYVGLVTGVCFADLGNFVTCVDINPSKLSILKRGEVPFYEPGLSEKMTRNFEAKRLVFTDNLAETLSDATVIFIAVGTPPAADGSADLTAVMSVAQSVIDWVETATDDTPRALVTKSTVPVGTGQKIQGLVDQKGLSSRIKVVSNPEFLREGSAVQDFFQPDRIVLGSNDEWALDCLADLHAPLFRRDTPIIRTDLMSSELSKYASNAFLATKISFINEISNLCERVGANVSDVAKIMGKDGRIGPYFLHPGPGYGGSCFPKDIKALVQIGREHEVDFQIVPAVERVNESQKQHGISFLDGFFPSGLSGKKVALLGAAYKPATDDIREAPSLSIISHLLSQGVEVSLCDPEAMPNIKGVYEDQLRYCESSYEAVKGADAVVLVTEWNVFRDLDLSRILSEMNDNVFLDLRCVYQLQQLKEAGFRAYVTGALMEQGVLRT